jgi:hypothetical protein
MVDYRTPPAKQLYLILQALLALVRVPWWGFVSLVPALRPNPRWSFTRAFFSRLTHRLATVDVVCAPPLPRATGPAHAPIQCTGVRRAPHAPRDCARL